MWSPLPSFLLFSVHSVPVTKRKVQHQHGADSTLPYSTQIVPDFQFSKINFNRTSTHHIPLDALQSSNLICTPEGHPVFQFYFDLWLQLLTDSKQNNKRRNNLSWSFLMRRKNQFETNPSPIGPTQDVKMNMITVKETKISAEPRSRTISIHCVAVEWGCLDKMPH